MKVKDYLDQELKPVLDIIFKDSNNYEIQLEASDYDRLEVDSVEYQMVAVIKLKK